jgi:multicomponent Na+:H+ antiporter subunit F
VIVAATPSIEPTPFVEQALLVAASALTLFALVAMVRVLIGPTMYDRILGTNVVGSNTVVILVLLTAAFGEPTFLDVALVYGLLNFLISIAVSKFTVEWGDVL